MESPLRDLDDELRTVREELAHLESVESDLLEILQRARQLEQKMIAWQKRRQLALVDTTLSETPDDFVLSRHAEDQMAGIISRMTEFRGRRDRLCQAREIFLSLSSRNGVALGHVS